MKANHDEILSARNKTKKRCNVYYYEAMGTMARGMGFTASEFFFGCASMAMLKMGCELNLSKRDLQIIERIRFEIANSKRKT